MRHVLAALAGRETPVTAQELFIELRDNGHSLGLATVYRALHVLRDDGRLHEFHVEDGIAFRACAPEPHHHLVCLQCGRVQEEHTTTLGDWLDHVRHSGFAVQACTIEIYGTCRRCQPAQRNRRIRPDQTP